MDDARISALRRLLKADADDAPKMLGHLKELAGCEMTYARLGSTKIGGRVKTVSTSNVDEGVRRAADKIVDAWKDLEAAKKKADAEAAPPKKKKKKAAKAETTTAVKRKRASSSSAAANADFAEGQTKETPPPAEGTRVFYETLHVEKKGKSEMAADWLTKHGCLPASVK